MGIFGSAFGRALAGAGEGVSSLAGKYLDEQILMNKARAMEELRLMSEQRLDQYRNSPERRESLRQESAKDDDAKYEQTVRQRLSEAKNTDLTAAEIDKANKIAEGTAPSRAAAEGIISRARGLNTPHVLSPGQQVSMGGEVLDDNRRPTPAEASLAAYREGLKGPGATSKLDRMSEAGKVQLQGIEKRDAALQQLIDKGLAEGTLSEKPTGPDGKPNPGYDQYQSVLRQRQSVHISRQRLLASEGVIDGGDDGQWAVENAATPADLEESVSLARKIGGSYAKDFLATVDPALRQMRSTDYKQDAIRTAAARNGDKNYDVQVNGERSQVRTGTSVTPRAAPVAEPISPEATALDEARAAAVRARDNVLSFGSAKRQKDPEGFERAKQEVLRAAAALREAESAYRATVGAGRAAFRTQTP